MVVIKFPRRRQHGRSSAKAGEGFDRRAANLVKSSAVTPFCPAISVCKIDDQYSEGIQSRSHHLRAAKTDAPMSPASASGDFQSAMTSQKVEIESVMESEIRQIVLKLNPILSNALQAPASDTCLMAKKPASSTEYLKAFTTRIYSAREHAGLTQEQMAHILQTSQPTYSKYEVRSLLPHRHIWTFCLSCHVSVEWLVTGQGKGVPLRARPERAHRPGRRARKRAAAA